jgi:AcrR family transcriptional regulator
MTGGGPGNESAATPRSELARIRAGQAQRDSDLRDRLLDATLEQCGRRGYREATVQDAIDACGTNRVRFYGHFASKEECFEEAHGARIEQLSGELLAAGEAEADWCSGLCAGLRALGSAVVGRPDYMRGLLVEAHVVGGAALTKRTEILERLSRAVDLARIDQDLGHASPPPLTAAFMVGAIEACVTRSLLDGRPEEFVEALPELARMVADPYFGESGGRNAGDPKEMGILLRVEMPA